MSRAGQFNESRAHQRRAGRAGGFGGGGGGGKIPPAEGCKLFYSIKYPYRIDENNPIVRTPAFWWNDGPSSRVVDDDWFHYREGEGGEGELRWAVRLDIPIQSQVFDTFGKDMGFFGAHRDDTKVFSSAPHEGIDDFGPFVSGFGEGYVDALSGGRGGYIGWKRITSAILRSELWPDYYSLILFDRLGDIYRSHPVEMSMANGPVNVGRHEWWQEPEWHDEGDPWRSHWERVLTVRANGVWPGPGRGTMVAQKWRDNTEGTIHYPEFREQGFGVGTAGPNASFAGRDSFVTDQQDDSRLGQPGPGWDWGRYLIDQRSGQPLTDREFVTGGGEFFGWEWNRRNNEWGGVRIADGVVIETIESHPIWGLIYDDGFEDVVPFGGGMHGVSHGYGTQVVTYAKHGSWRDMRRILVVQFAFDQYGVLGYGERRMVPVQYNYSSVGWHPGADVGYDLGGIAGK